MPPGTVQHADQSLVKKLAEILTRCIYAVEYGIAGKGIWIVADVKHMDGTPTEIRNSLPRNT